MTRKLLVLNGLAIIGIAIEHANAYGMQAMFFWTDRYLPVSVPNFDQLNSLGYYLTLIMRQLAIFTVPAFLFISGFFIAFMARGANAKVTLGSILPRVKVLLIPFLVWTTVRYLLLRRFPTSIDEILNPYHFVPLLIQFYLISPILVPLARTRAMLLLGIAAAIHLGGQVLNYLAALGVTSPTIALIEMLTPRWVIFGQLPFWFPFGLVVGLHIQAFQAWVNRYKKLLLIGTIVFGVGCVAEYLLLDALNGSQWLNPSIGGISKTAFSLTFILWFLSSDDRTIPFTKAITAVSAKSLGIYLGNIPAVYVIALLMYYLTPVLLGLQFYYQVILFIAGLFGPLLLMELIQRSPAKRYYRYIFG